MARVYATRRIKKIKAWWKTCDACGARGRVVQVDPMISELKSPGTNRLKLKCDKLLSSFAFNLNLRRYSKERGRAVRVDPMKLKLKPPGTERLKLKCYILLSTSAFKFNLRRYNEAYACRTEMGQGLTLVHFSAQHEPVLVIEAKARSTSHLNLCHFMLR